jgi:2-iminobutanoate/2-iminopropanoate deaminase
VSVKRLTFPKFPPPGEIVEGGIKEQTHQVMTNLGEVLKASGSSLNRVVKTTVFLKNMNDFVAMNEVYGTVSMVYRNIEAWCI